MLKYNMKIVPVITAKYKKISSAYELMGAVIQNCPQSILPQDKAVLARALAKARQGAEQAEQNISLCHELTELYKSEQLIDKELYKKILLNISENLAGLYKLNLLLFDNLLIGADMLQQSYLDDDTEPDDDLSEFYEEELLNLSLEERMEKMSCIDYTDFCKNYPDLVTPAEFEQLVQAGLISSADDTLVHQGRIYENEFSEQWEEYEYEYDKYRK